MKREDFIRELLENTIGCNNMAEFARQTNISRGIVQAVKFGSQQRFKAEDVAKIVATFPFVNSLWVSSCGTCGEMLNNKYEKATSSTSERMIKLLEYLQMTPTEFANAINVKSDKIFAIRSGKQKSITVPLAYQIHSVYNNVSADWLTTGNGEMLNLDLEEEKDNNNTDRPNPSPLDDLAGLIKDIKRERETIYEALKQCLDILGSCKSTLKETENIQLAIKELMSKSSHLTIQKYDSYDNTFVSEEISRDKQ